MKSLITGEEIDPAEREAALADLDRHATIAAANAARRCAESKSTASSRRERQTIILRDKIAEKIFIALANFAEYFDPTQRIAIANSLAESVDAISGMDLERETINTNIEKDIDKAIAIPGIPIGEIPRINQAVKVAIHIAQPTGQEELFFTELRKNP